MSECKFPTGAPTAGYFDGSTGVVSELGKKFLREGGWGRRIYVYEYWHSFLARKGDYETTFMQMPQHIVDKIMEARRVRQTQ